MGHTFVGDAHSLSSTPVAANDIVKVVISNGIYDELYFSQDIKQNYTLNIPDEWDYYTILHAYFRNNLSAGNIDFVSDNIDTIRIKRRAKGGLNWVYLFDAMTSEGPNYTSITTRFEIFDYTARSNTDYEYALVPVSGAVEGDYIVNSIKTNFDGLFIFGNDSYFTTKLDADVYTQQQNRSHSVIPTFGRKYPFIISNGYINYKSGNLSANFVPIDVDNCKFDFENSWKYRELLNDFLLNGDPKLIKLRNGQMWLVGISGLSINESKGEHEYLINTNFEWTEIGDCDDGETLYNNGFVDVRHQEGLSTS